MSATPDTVPDMPNIENLNRSIARAENALQDAGHAVDERPFRALEPSEYLMYALANAAIGIGAGLLALAYAKAAELDE